MLTCAKKQTHTYTHSIIIGVLFAEAKTKKEKEMKWPNWSLRSYLNEWYRSIWPNSDKCPQNISREIKGIKICVASFHLSKIYFMYLHHRKILESYMPKLTSVGEAT